MQHDLDAQQIIDRRLSQGFLTFFEDLLGRLDDLEGVAGQIGGDLRGHGLTFIAEHFEGFADSDTLADLRSAVASFRSEFDLSSDDWQTAFADNGLTADGKPSTAEDAP